MIMDFIQELAPLGPLFIAFICFFAFLTAIGGFFAFIVKLMQAPIKKDIENIKENLNNHITDLKAGQAKLETDLRDLRNLILKKL